MEFTIDALREVRGMAVEVCLGCLEHPCSGNSMSVIIAVHVTDIHRACLVVSATYNRAPERV